jgi:purine-nucleoside phosphorylase
MASEWGVRGGVDQIVAASCPRDRIAGVSTHIGAEPGQIAETVLLPGDPLRAQWIAEKFLVEPEQHSAVRNMLGFTGTYKGHRVSVQGTGMGQPSLAIYVNELLTQYGAKTVIRVGSCGSLTERLGLRSIVLASSAGTDSAMNRLRFEGLDFAPVADFGLLRSAYDIATERGIAVEVGQIFSADSFYNDRAELVARLAGYGVLAVEMEASALYTLAAKHGARALSICTVSDVIPTGAELSAEDRQSSFSDMAELALELTTRE